ncbi:hypothetical protein PYCC9005_004503 [Savitreella phatthalungensis]
MSKGNVYDSFNVALVTGGAGGLGRVIAENFIKHGKKVILAGRTLSKLEATAKELGSGVAGVVEVDTGKLDALPHFVKDVTSKYPELDCFVNNAGIMHNHDLAGMGGKSQEYRNEVNINITGVVELCNLFIPYLKTKSSGAIMNVSSGLSIVPIAITPVYCGTKAFVKFFTMTLRAQVEANKDTRHIRVIEIVPPLVDSDLHRNFDNGLPDNIAKNAISQDTFIAHIEEGLQAGKDLVAAGSARDRTKQWQDTFGGAFEMMNPSPKDA